MQRRAANTILASTHRLTSSWSVIAHVISSHPPRSSPALPKPHTAHCSPQLVATLTACITMRWTHACAPSSHAKTMFCHPIGHPAPSTRFPSFSWMCGSRTCVTCIIPSSPAGRTVCGRRLPAQSRTCARRCLCMIPGRPPPAARRTNPRSGSALSGTWSI